jgi:hypothetical protein
MVPFTSPPGHATAPHQFPRPGRRSAVTSPDTGQGGGHHWRKDQMPDFKPYRRRSIAEMRPYQPGEDLAGVSVAVVDSAAGSPKEGDMIARNPKNHADQWLVAAKYFAENFAPL